jgi:hypothetical protein
MLNIKRDVFIFVAVLLIFFSLLFAFDNQTRMYNEKFSSYEDYISVLESKLFLASLEVNELESNCYCFDDMFK